MWVMSDPSTGINSDRSRLAIAHTASMDWQASPSPTVWRKRLELVGDREKGMVTSVVRYDANSQFASHGHPAGEEFLVLEGVFSDEYGDYPAGSYVLNPPGFSHAPFSREGCQIFVKLRQYPGANRRKMQVDTNATGWQMHPVAGVEVLPLYAEAGHPEEMRLVRLAAGARVPTVAFPKGEEIFVLHGGFTDEHGSYGKGSWVRYPAGSSHTPTTEDGCTLYVKKGHLG